MKHFLLALFLTATGIASAQRPGPSGNSYYAIESGLTNFHPWSLNANASGVSDPFTYLLPIGISVNSTTGGRFGDFSDANIAFHVYNRNFIEWYTDSTSLFQGGWELMTSIFGFDLIPNKHIDFVLAPGMYWGNLRLRWQARGGEYNEYRYKNPFVAPMARAELRFTFWRIAMGVRISYRYDITKDVWKNKDNGPTLPGYRFREGQYVIYMGWLIDKQK